MDINVGNDWCNANDGYLGGDRNKNHRNACHVTDGSGSLIERPGRDYYGVNSYEIGESSRGTGFQDPSYGARPICKYYAQGRCQNAQKCRFPHYSAHQNQLRHDPVAMHTSHTFFSDGREKPGSQSQGMFTSGTPYGYNGYQFKDPGRNNCSRFPLENFGSHEHALSEELASSNSLLLSTDNINSEQFQSTHARNGNLSRKTGLHSIPWNIDQVAGRQETIYGIRQAPTVQITTHLPTATTPWPSNGQVHINEFSVLKTQGDFIVPQPHVNSPVLSLQGQPVLPRAHALPDLSPHNGQRFDFDGQFLKNLVAGSQSKEISRQVLDTGVQSMQMQSTWNLKPGALNVQGEHQTSQFFSVLPHKRSADMIGAQIDHKTASSEDACINPNLAPNNSKAPLTAGPIQKQPSKRNMDPRLATLAASLSAAPPSLPVPPNHQGVMLQPETSVRDGRQIHTIEVAFCNGNAEILSHSVTLSAGNTVVNPSEGNKRESECTVQAKENGNKQMNENKMFKIALANFVQEGLKEAWHGGHLTKELYKKVARKVVEKIMSSEKNIPQTKQRIGSYLKLYKRKIDRLILEYLGIYTNGKLCR